MSGTSDNVVKGFRVPQATARTGYTVDLVRRKRLPRMKDAIERMVTKRLHECVDMIRHHDIFAEHIPLPVEEIQNTFDQSKSLRMG